MMMVIKSNLGTWQHAEKTYFRTPSSLHDWVQDATWSHHSRPRGTMMSIVFASYPDFDYWSSFIKSNLPLPWDVWFGLSALQQIGCILSCKCDGYVVSVLCIYDWQLESKSCVELLFSSRTKLLCMQRERGAVQSCPVAYSRKRMSLVGLRFGIGVSIEIQVSLEGNGSDTPRGGMRWFWAQNSVGLMLIQSERRFD